MIKFQMCNFRRYKLLIQVKIDLVILIMLSKLISLRVIAKTKNKNFHLLYKYQIEKFSNSDLMILLFRKYIINILILLIVLLKYL